MRLWLGVVIVTSLASTVPPHLGYRVALSLRCGSSCRPTSNLGSGIYCMPDQGSTVLPVGLLFAYHPTVSLRRPRWQIECRSVPGWLCTRRPSRMPKRGLATTSAAIIQRRSSRVLNKPPTLIPLSQFPGLDSSGCTFNLVETHSRRLLG